MRNSIRVRGGVVVAGLGALVLAAGTTGCAGVMSADEQSADMTPAAAVAEAGKKTEDITSLRYRMVGKEPGSGTVKGEGVMSTKPLAMSMKMHASMVDDTVEMRMVGKALYLGGGGAVAKELDGKHWMRFDAAALGKTPQVNKWAPGQDARQNPTAESTFLTGSKDVKRVGTERVDGVRTTHYRGTVSLDDLRSSLKKEDKETRERRERSLERYEEMGVDSLTMDMWIDGSGYGKQVRVRGAADDGPLDMTTTFLDINKPVTVKAPPAEDTVDLAEMMKEAQQG